MSESISHMVLQRRRQRGRKEYSHPLTYDSRSFRRIEKHGAWAIWVDVVEDEARLGDILKSRTPIELHHDIFPPKT
jgi:hypothetical protein